VNVSSKPVAADVEIHGNFVDGREIEAGSGAMLDVRRRWFGGNIQTSLPSIMIQSVHDLIALV